MFIILSQKTVIGLGKLIRMELLNLNYMISVFAKFDQKNILLIVREDNDIMFLNSVCE